MRTKIKLLIPFIASPFFINTAFAIEESINIRLNSWTAKINPKTLEVIGKFAEKENTIASTPHNDLGNIQNLEHNNETASWSFPNKQLSVTIKKDGDNLIFTYLSEKDQILNWPSTDKNKNVKDIIIPDGEGLIIPVTNRFWQNAYKKYSATEYEMQSAMTMPFFTNRTNSNTISYISQSSLNNTLHFLNSNHRMYVLQSHEFRKQDGLPPYTISINLSNDLNPLASAFIFRKELIKNSEFKNLSKKEKENPNIKKLYGAIHTYVWGTGRTEEFLVQLNALNIKHMWIGTDTGETDKYKIDNSYIKKAINYGYLVGPYDTWENVQNPKTADTPLSIFPNAWPNAAVIDSKGKKILGFHNRGYEASSQYFAQQNPSNKDLKDRLNKFAETGINSYFLDVDATGTLHDDYSPHHPMNIEKDLQNRITRMNLISQDKKLVLGSETAVYQFVPHIAFAHGNASVFNGPHWKLTRDQKIYGRWYPNERPEFFYKSAYAPQEYVKTKYNPVYRIPLFQAVFHDSIITTDRWEIPITKFKNVMKERILIELLYGTPSIWALDKKEIKDYSTELKSLYSFFSPLHQKIAPLPLTKFEWLTDDKMIQRTQFGDEAQLTANFSDKIFKGIPAKSIELNWLKENKKEIFKP